MTCVDCGVITCVAYVQVCKGFGSFEPEGSNVRVST